MEFTTVLYNAFSGISLREASAVIRFLRDHVNDSNEQHIRDAVDYALKLKPSFGGFVLVAKIDNEIVACVVANRTGMEGYSPDHIFVFAGLHTDYRKEEEMMQTILQKALSYTGGHVAMHVMPNHPEMKILQDAGFRAEYLELRLQKVQPKPASAVA